jgi:hypothetical protein
VRAGATFIDGQLKERKEAAIESSTKEDDEGRAAA